MDDKTKIVATIGPASMDRKTLKQMIKSGVSCARINTAHGDFKQYDKMLRLIRGIKDLPVMIDVKGPEIRIRLEKELVVEPRKEYIFYYKNKKPFFSYDFSKEIRQGDKIFFDNGQIKSRVKKKDKDSVSLVFEEESVIHPNKGVNIPGKSLKIPSLSKKDVQAIKYSLKNKAAFIALSFVRNRKDVEGLKKLLKESEIGIISKIENNEGIKNIDEIIDASDGIMIARGDLGVEIPEEKIPVLQKNIIRKCIQKGRISIVATQMLESMTHHPMPTRAEVSDVANAIMDGADAVMLSGETASGKHPVKAVQVMRKVARETEKTTGNKVDMSRTGGISEEMSKAAYHISLRVNTDKIICVTRSGYSAALLSRFRSNKELLAVTRHEMTARKLGLVRGVKPVLLKEIPLKDMIPSIAKELYKEKHLAITDKLVFFAGIKTLKEHVSNLIEVHDVKELLEYKKVK